MPRVKHAPDLKLFNPKARRPPPSWVGDMESWGQESPALADSLAARLLPRRKGNQAILRTHPYLCGRLRSLREVRCHHTIFGLPETSHRLMLMESARTINGTEAAPHFSAHAAYPSRYDSMPGCGSTQVGSAQGAGISAHRVSFLARDIKRCRRIQINPTGTTSIPLLPSSTSYQTK